MVLLQDTFSEVTLSCSLITAVYTVGILEYVSPIWEKEILLKHESD